MGFRFRCVRMGCIKRAKGCFQYWGGLHCIWMYVAIAGYAAHTSNDDITIQFHRLLNGYVVVDYRHNWFQIHLITKWLIIDVGKEGRPSLGGLVQKHSTISYLLRLIHRTYRSLFYI